MNTPFSDDVLIPTPRVTVCMITYNHAEYIRQAIDGVLMQKTEFPYELVIGEDCGTDSTRSICEEYAAQFPNKVRLLPSEQNLGICKNFYRTLHSAQGEYIAFCEGDDYWTDPHKLQIQVEYLNAHRDTGCVYTDFSMYYQQSGRLEQSLFRNFPHNYMRHSDLTSFISRPLYLAPCTWMFRRELLQGELPHTVDGTFVLFAHLLWQAKVGFMPVTTAVYRILPESATHSASYEKSYARAAGLYAIQRELAEKYGLTSEQKYVIDRDYYTQNLQLLVCLGKAEELAEAYRILQEKPLKIRHRFWLVVSRNPAGRWLIRRHYAKQCRRHHRR